MIFGFPCEIRSPPGRKGVGGRGRERGPGWIPFRLADGVVHLSICVKPVVDHSFVEGVCTAAGRASCADELRTIVPAITEEQSIRGRQWQFCTRNHGGLWSAAATGVVTPSRLGSPPYRDRTWRHSSLSLFLCLSLSFNFVPTDTQVLGPRRRETGKRCGTSGMQLGPVAWVRRLFARAGHERSSVKVQEKIGPPPPSSALEAGSR